MKFVYNNAKNANTSYIFSDFYCDYYLRVFFGDKVDSYLKSRSANKPGKKLGELILIYLQNLFHI